MDKQIVGVVVIGRNEGERLKRCLQTVQAQTLYYIYVDSGSSDGSMEHAFSVGVNVVKLDMSIPFSAGRARNEGFTKLIATYPHLAYVQFIDGDCELSEGWINTAVEFLKNNDPYAIVAGRRKEKFPEQSIYNLLCEIEWDGPAGEVKACGGDFMVRKEAFQQISGFNPSVIAGEEPELCYRLSEKGWKIFRLDHLMTMHDAAITRFPQWWKRAVRSGHAYAQGYFLHGRAGQGYCRWESMKIWLWAFFFPLAILFFSILVSPSYLFILSAYLLQAGKIAISINKQLMNLKDSTVYALFTVLSRWPQLTGQILFISRSFMKKDFKVIDYQ